MISEVCQNSHQSKLYRGGLIAVDYLTDYQLYQVILVDKYNTIYFLYKRDTGVLERMNDKFRLFRYLPFICEIMSLQKNSVPFLPAVFYSVGINCHISDKIYNRK